MLNYIIYVSDTHSCECAACVYNGLEYNEYGFQTVAYQQLISIMLGHLDVANEANSHPWFLFVPCVTLFHFVVIFAPRN